MLETGCYVLKGLARFLSSGTQVSLTGAHFEMHSRSRHSLPHQSGRCEAGRLVGTDLVCALNRAGVEMLYATQLTRAGGDLLNPLQFIDSASPPGVNHGTGNNYSF